jgi:hypothetical protein
MIGRPCDKHGNYLAANTPPTPTELGGGPGDWSPFRDRVEFELADFLYTQVQMSAGKINALLDLWAASLFKHGDEPPFADDDDLYTTIDSIPHGDVTWECFSTSYQGARPDGQTPSWMDVEYEVWFRDPRTVIRNMLANPDFDSQIDFVPLHKFDADDERQFQNFMSGDWAWQQAVCRFMG